MKKMTPIEYNKLLIMGYYGLDDAEALEISKAHAILNISKDIDIHRFAINVIDMDKREKFAKNIAREALAEEKRKLGILNDSIKQL